MSNHVFSVPPTAKLAEVRDKLLSLRISSVAVLDLESSELLGIVTRTDLFRAGTVRGTIGLAQIELPDSTVDSIMTREPILVDAGEPISKAARIMVERHIHRVLVTEGGGIAGVLSARDVTRVVAASGDTTPLREIMSQPILAVRVNQTLSDAIDTLEGWKVQGLVVLDKGWPCGVLTQEEIIAARDLDSDTPVEQVLNPAMLVLPVDMPVHRAAANAGSVDVRMIVAARGFQAAGVVTGLDFCRLASG